MNFIKTSCLMAVMTALFLGVGFMIAGEGGMLIAFLIAVALNGTAYWNSDKMVLSMHGAEPITPEADPRLYQMVAGLAARADLPMPRLYIIQKSEPNAFATGRNPENGAVAVTSGLIQRLTKDELAGVIAHELAHIKNRDTLLMTMTATLAGAISFLANFAFFFGGNRQNPLGFIGMLLVMIMAPIAAMLVQMAISRTREYSADALGAEICGNPKALADALHTISNASRSPHKHREREANPATAHLFISNPLQSGQFKSLFSTHPPMEERIRRLRAMEKEMGLSGGPITDIQANNRIRWPRSGSPSRSSGLPATEKSPKRGPWG